MINNKGFGKFETLTVIVVIMGIIAFLLYCTLNAADSRNFPKLRTDAAYFNKIVFSNLDSFINQDFVTLGETVDQNLVDEFKSPFSKGKCDRGESFVITRERERYVTIKCDEYLIDDVISTDLDKAPIYKVGKWQEEPLEGDNVQSMELYNCDEGGKMVLDNFSTGSYLAHVVNEQNGTRFYSENEITSCEVIKKTFYRTKELVED